MSRLFPFYLSCLFLRALQHAVPPVTAISNFTFLYTLLLGIL
ncbi:hypothetical protein FAEPRAM212_01304 [Faecalibacterium prausnitzii M21/2]|uniref:Uncharacterized protein n=1 Tax=Faecalibacterium prausnitzii M21/2 TaxID=411485 RepID=A8SAA6_9FIRM|nr:hypothetical protein FAEPRAM212_01304 [Faecalibacterium prausnitzii M21/2]